VQNVRTLNFEALEIGGDSAIPFMSENNNRAKVLFAIEIPFYVDAKYPQILVDYWGKDTSFIDKVKKAQQIDCDLISLKFNLSEENLDDDIKKVISELDEISKFNCKPLILRGANNKAIDTKLLPKITEILKKQSIIAFADDMTYKDIAPAVAKTNHSLVLRSPIDINLAKELNILAVDEGMSADRLLIDPDMGGLGYGLDYGYSIIEKIRQAAFDGDVMLNMPIIVFAGEEIYRAKEAKSDSFDENWGDYNERACMWEIAAVSALISSGVNICVVWNPQTIKTFRGIL